jgi:hypothetical protein
MQLPIVEVSKSSIPIIWLDTFIIINMTQWKLGKSIEKIQKDRVAYLYNKIYELTRKKKLICPIADQKEEIWIGRSDCLKTMLELSLGIHSNYSMSVRDYQTRQFMEAFIYNKGRVEINYKEFFIDDPEKQLSSNSKFIVSADLGLLEKPEKLKKRNIDRLNKLENLRQSIVKQNISFEEQLEKEFMAELAGISILSNKPIDKLTYQDFIGVNDYWIYWNNLSDSYSDFLSFFYSSYYRKTPVINIDCQMSAKILTGNDPFRSGHTMDISHASAAIPYVNIFITDRYMKKIICDLKIDDYYETKVLHIGEINQIENILISYE